MERASIVWFRQDLRIEDQPALSAAITKGGSIIPLYILAPEEEKEWALGKASQWWLHGALSRLQHDLQQLGLPLILRRDSSEEAIKEIAKQTNADTLFCNRCYEPHVMERDAFLKGELNRLGIKIQTFNGSLLFEPWSILNKQNKPYQVFTPFWKFCSQLEEPKSLAKPRKAVSPHEVVDSESLESFHLLPNIPWDKGLQEKWRPQIYCAKQQLQRALKKVIAHYSQTRDELAIEGTTELSPYLHFGEISPRMIWSAVRNKFGKQPEAEAFLRQLGWREFAYYLLYHFPNTSHKSLRSDFNSFAWQTNPFALRAWQRGMTGYPIVDAGMRQLWQVGWMHNRARMIVGSFLVKDLLIDWREGARWFWDTLVDADLANNTLGWQWIAGCGADAAPYFRIFNPITQGEKFDPKGEYVRRWIPELSALPDRWIHCPWEASEETLQKAGVQLGVTYPKPIVDHGQARKRALEAYKKIIESKIV